MEQIKSKIIFELTCVRAPMTGVAYYTVHMIKAMMSRYPELNVRGVYQGKMLTQERVAALFENVSNKASPVSSKRSYLVSFVNRWSVLRTLVQFGRDMKHRLYLSSKLKGHLYHEPNFIFLPHDGPKVVTLHDVSMFVCPQYLPNGRASFLRAQLRKSIPKADAIIVSCKYIMDEVLALFPSVAGKVHIVPPGVNEVFKPKNELQVARTLGKHQLKFKRFILCVATLEPRKNLVRLIGAYSQLPAHLKHEYPLVLVGGKGWQYDALLKEVHGNDQESDIRLMQYLKEDELADIYSSAKLFVYPSLYEGFGLPVLEAMQAGIPVITSNVSSLPEVCGEAGTLIDPENEKEIADAMSRLLSTDDNEYARISKSSIERAAEFSWEKMADQLVKIYAGLLS